MPTIELSKYFVADSSSFATSPAGFPASCRVIGAGYASSTGQTAAPALAQPYARPLIDTPSANRSITQLMIMKGAVPADFSTLVDFTSRSADALITFSTSASGQNNFDIIPNDNSTTYLYGLDTMISTNYVAATAAGVATWFWMVSRQSTSSSAVTNVLYHQVFGTVGLPGSGADLEITNLETKVGKLYKVSGLRLSIPTTYTY